MTTSTHPEGSCQPSAVSHQPGEDSSPQRANSPRSKFSRRKSLGVVLRAAREGARLTLKELGHLLNLAPSYLSDLEHDKRDVTMQLCDPLSQVLGLDRILLYAKSGNLPYSVREYLAKTPRALHVLDRLASRRANDAFVRELLDWMDTRAGDVSSRTEEGEPLPVEGSENE